MIEIMIFKKFFALMDKAIMQSIHIAMNVVSRMLPINALTAIILNYFVMNVLWKTIWPILFIVST